MCALYNSACGCDCTRAPQYICLQGPSERNIYTITQNSSNSVISTV